MATNKFYDDNFVDNKSYSKIGGIEIDELMELEIVLLSSIGWNVNIDQEKFYDYFAKMQKIYNSSHKLYL